MKNPIISIIILVKNDPGIEVTLAALKHIHYPAETEVLVIDASTPENITKYRTRHPNVRWLPFDVSQIKKLTFPEQRNAAIANTFGKYILFLDCGCIPNEDWLEKQYKLLQTPNIVVSTRITSKGRQSVFEIDPNTLNQKIIERFEAGGIGLGFSRDIFNRIGKFDERFTFAEDVDFTWRARLMGYKILLNTEAIVAHDWEKWDKEVLRAFKYGASRAKLYKKYPRLWRQLFGHDLHALAYSLFILGLPTVFVCPYYLLILIIPVVKNLKRKPFQVVLVNLLYGTGFIYGAIRKGYGV